MTEMPIVIKIDDTQKTVDMSFPAGSIFGLPLENIGTPMLVDCLRDFGVSRVVLDAREGLDHPLAATLKEAGLMVAAGQLHCA